MLWGYWSGLSTELHYGLRLANGRGLFRPVMAIRGTIDER